MVSKTAQKAVRITALLAMAMLLFAPGAMAAEEAAEGEAGGSSSLGDGIKMAGVAIGAGLAMLGGAVGTGRAQAAIGAGGTGAMAEKPELFGRIFILVAIPETIVVLGFVIALTISAL